MIYFQSKDISKKLNIKLAKWKRWSREFLPPDALGGLQSGIARQFNLKEAFKVFLGGYLVGELKFTIPAAIQILADLTPWLKANGFFQLQPQMNRREHGGVPEHFIYIHCLPVLRFVYVIRAHNERVAAAGNGRVRETYIETLIHADSDPMRSAQAHSAHVVAVTALYDHFIGCLDGSVPARSVVRSTPGQVAGIQPPAAQ